jgi:hypothetical protein
LIKTAAAKARRFFYVAVAPPARVVTVASIIVALAAKLKERG